MIPAVPAWDRDGTVRAIPMDRVLSEGLKHMAVSVVVSAGTDVLVLRRDGRWTLPVILPRWSEHYAVAAARLLRDEFGLTGVFLGKGPLVEYAAGPDDPPGAAVVQVFRAAFDDRPLPAGEGLRWVPSAALAAGIARAPADYSPWLKALAARHPDQFPGAADHQDPAP